MASAAHPVRRPARPFMGLLHRAPDRRLLELARTGDERAFAAIYDRHAPALLSFCRHLLGSQADAEDALQQVFVSVHRSLLADERDIELRPWLFVVARNASLGILRRRRPADPLEDVDSLRGLPDEVEQREELRAMVGDLRRLPEQQRSALLLAELGGLSHPQVAEVLGVRPEKVKALVFQARSNLLAEREAREMSCATVREHIAASAGKGLRGLPARHLARCPECRSFRQAVRGQHRDLQALLPVAGVALLRGGVMRAALGHHVSGAGAGAALATGAASGGAPLLAKGLATLAIAGAAGAVTVAAVHHTATSRVAASPAIHRLVSPPGAARTARTDPAGPRRAPAARVAPARASAARAASPERGAPAALPPASVARPHPVRDALAPGHRRHSTTSAGRRGSPAARSHRHGRGSPPAPATRPVQRGNRPAQGPRVAVPQRRVGVPSRGRAPGRLGGQGAQGVLRHLRPPALPSG